ncbi:MAG: tRNA-dihydrouridine synthase [Parcubacteria group bacterium Greene0416_79]|nr:MAG: tRNA-dihydrouridine synthase [Parcubacteria group bacterium Greene0416_79]
MVTENFWRRLKRPIMAQAPMANVTDAAFRRIIAKYGKPDVLFTEFVSADGLLSEGREALLAELIYSGSERPIVAQLFSGNPEKMFEAGMLVKKLGFDGLDINMGCPDRSIEKSGAGAALIKNPRLAREIIRAGKEGASGLPVSIKTRLGYNRDELEAWLPELLEERPAAITIHARTRKEMSKVPAHWDRVKHAVEMRDALKSQTLILGNGDVMSIAEAKEKAEETEADGIMLGRAIFGNPWLFANSRELANESVQKLMRNRLPKFSEITTTYLTHTYKLENVRMFFQFASAS